MRFEWDTVKATANLRKHKISFELAVCVFSDPLAVSFQDRIESNESRWKTLGLVNDVLLLLVVHTIRNEYGVEIIRIISACKAIRQERQDYEQKYR